MAGGFTEQIESPRPIEAPYRLPSGNSTSEILGRAASGLGEAARAVVGQYNKGEVEKANTDVTGKLNDLIQQYTNNPSEQQKSNTQLVGTGGTNPADSAASSSPVVAGAVSSLDKLDQKNRQVHMSQDEFWIRGAGIVQDAVNRNPFYAQEIRESARSVLGVQPTVEQIRIQAENDTLNQRLNQAANEDWIKKAADSGVSYAKPDGTLDLDKMTEAGRQLDAEDATYTKEMREAQLKAANAKVPLSDDQQHTLMVNTTIRAINPTFEKVSDGMLSSVEALVNKYKGDPKAAAGIAQDINNQEGVFMAGLDRWMIKNNVDPKVAEETEAYYTGMFNHYRSLATGDTSQYKTNADYLKALETNWGIRFNESAPTLAQAKYAGGEPLVAAVVTNSGMLNPSHVTTMQTEANNIFNTPPNPVQLGQKTAAAAANQYDVSKEQNPQHQAAVIGTLATAIRNYTVNPDQMDPQHQKAFGNSLTQISNTADTVNDAGELEAAAKIVNDPGVVRGFFKFASNGDNAGALPRTVLGLLQIYSRHVETVGKDRLGPGQTVLINDPNPIYKDVDPRTPIPRIQVTVGSQFNVTTGKVEATYKASRNGTEIKLTPQILKASYPAFNEYFQSQNQVNRSLDAAAQINKYNPVGREGELSPSQVKQVMVSASMIPLAPGQSMEKMPDWINGNNPQTEQPAAPPAPAISTAPLAPATPDAGGPSAKYNQNLTDAESSGDTNAANPLSTAVGPGQWTAPSWADAAKRLAPDLFEGKSPEEIESMRNDPDTVAKVNQIEAEQNTKRFTEAGLSNIDDTALEIAHRFGFNGAMKLLDAPASAKAENVFPPQVLKANPDLRGHTVQEIYDSIDKKMSK